MNPELDPPEPQVHILFAEDSPTQAMLLQNILEKNGFRATATPNGRMALEAMQRENPTMVITDIQMPEMDGYELCRRIKADASLKHIPVMLLTSLSAPQDIIRGLECGADNFVVKPYEEMFLVSRIRMILANLALRKAMGHEKEIAIYFAGEQYVISSDRRQILNLLLTTYETAVRTNEELIKAHEELKAAQAQLIEAEKLKSVGRLAAGVAHEVRNPLAIMEMGIGYLADQSASEDNKVILNEMREAVERANFVITELMDISSPRELGMGEVNLNEVMKNALAALQDRISEQQVAVSEVLTADLPLCRVDAGRIQQAFINVLTNACDAMDKGGALTIASYAKTLDPSEVAFDAGDRSGSRFRAGDRAVVIEVSDTGTGIAPENSSKLFEPFFSTKPTGKGMGLGLTVSKKVIDLHGGNIALRNREKGGVKVTMIFPISKPNGNTE